MSQKICTLFIYFSESSFEVSNENNAKNMAMGLIAKKIIVPKTQTVEWKTRIYKKPKNITEYKTDDITHSNNLQLSLSV